MNEIYIKYVLNLRHIILVLLKILWEKYNISIQNIRLKNNYV